MPSSAIQQNNSQGSISGTDALTFTSAVGAGHTLIAHIGADSHSGGMPGVTCSDNINGSWTLLAQTGDGRRVGMASFVFLGSAAASAGSMTVTISGLGNCVGNFMIIEYPACSSVRVATAASNNGSTLQLAVSLASTVANDLVVVQGNGDNTGPVLTAGTVGSNTAYRASGCWSDTVLAEDGLSSGGTISATFTQSDSAWVVIGAALVPASAGAPTEGYASFPDQLNRVPRAGLHASQHPATTLAPAPISTAYGWEGSYADVIFARKMHASMQPFFTMHPTPERTKTLAQAVFPDETRVRVRTIQDQAALPGVVVPERTMSLVTTATVDETRVRVRTLHDMAFVAGSLIPERQQTLAAASFADVAPGRALHPSQHPYTTGEPPAPERTTPLAAASFADAAPGRSLHASQHPYTTGQPPRPEQPQAHAFGGQHADIAPGRTIRPEAMPFFVLDPLPRPSTAPPTEGYASFPDQLNRVPPEGLHASQHPAFAFGPFPISTPYGWEPEFADYVPRTALSTGQHPAFAMSQKPEQTQGHAFGGQHADTAPGRSLHVAQHQAAALYPLPLPSLVAPTEGYASFPDRLNRVPVAGLHATQHPAFAFAPLPISTPYGWSGRWADAAPGKSLRPEAIPFFAMHPVPMPNLAAPTEGFASFPDWIWRAQPQGLHASEHPAFAFAPAPISTPMGWLPNYPPTAPGRFLATGQHPAIAFAPKPERTATIAVVVFSDWLVRPALTTAEHPAATEEPPRPERSSTLATGHVPEAARGVVLHVSSVPYFTMAPEPEGKALGEWQPSYPATAPAPTALTTEQHPAFALGPLPLPNAVPTFFGEPQWADVWVRAWTGLSLPAATGYWPILPPLPPIPPPYFPPQPAPTSRSVEFKIVTRDGGYYVVTRSVGYKPGSR